MLSIAKNLGWTLDEVRRMSMRDFIYLLDCHVDGIEKSKEPKVRKATQADIDAFMS